MKFNLTEKERCTLGWDDPGLKDQDPELYAVIRKCDGKTELTPDDIEILLSEFENLNTFGADGYYTKVTKGLLNKAKKLSK